MTMNSNQKGEMDQRDYETSSFGLIGPFFVSNCNLTFLIGHYILSYLFVFMQKVSYTHVGTRIATCASISYNTG